MKAAFRIRNRKYYRVFDDSDNPCCWQIGAIGADIKAILDAKISDYESMYEDWGVAYTWRNSEGVDHSLMTECVDVDTAEYSIQIRAFRKRVLFKQDVPDSNSDFVKILPALKNLNEKT
jgi:hypothetical protein